MWVCVVSNWWPSELLFWEYWLYVLIYHSDPPIKTAASQSSETLSDASPLTENFKLDLETLCHYAFCQYEHTSWLNKEISTNKLPTHPWSRCLIDYQCSRKLSFSRGLVVWLLVLEDNRSRSKVLIQLLWFTLTEKGRARAKIKTQPLQTQRKCSSHVYLGSNR